MYLVLSYFDNIFGPKVFYTNPTPLSNNLEPELLKYMNIDVPEGLIAGFSTTLDEKVKIINYSFEIPSEWARGKRELLMISIIVKNDYRTNMFRHVLKELSERIWNQSSEIYKAFYQSRSKYSNKEGIKIAVDKLNNILFEKYNDIKKVIENPNLGTFLTLGLSKAGKSTILHYLKNNAFKRMQPTIALQVIKILVDNKIFRSVDVSGQKRLRNQWWAYTKPPEAIIFVIDINDPPERLKEAKEEFSKIRDRILNQSNQISINIPILICLNKIDLINNIEEKEFKIIDFLDLDTSGLKYKVQLTSAKEGTGINEGIKWIFQELLKIS
mgnify:CR=1 FL=1